MSKFTDAWKRNQQFYPENERFTVQSPPDPGHGDYSELPNAVVMIDAPLAQGGGELLGSDVLFENIHHLAAGQKIDETPVEGKGTGSERGHGYGGSFEPISSDQGYGRGFLGNLRGRDLGADKRATSQFGRPYRFFNENWFGIFLTGMSAPPITTGSGDKVLRRGLNAYPENDGDSGRPHAWTVNTPSWRKGWYLWSNVNRDFTPPNRTHTNVRMVRPDIVTIVSSAPPPDKSDKYASPFFSLQKFRPKRRQIRGLRRVPGPFDEQAISNAQPNLFIPSVDGMVVN